MTTTFTLPAIPAPIAAVGDPRLTRLWQGIEQDYARLIPHYEPLIPPGSLVFDVGAQIGAYTHVFRTLGAEVVAVEPMIHTSPEYVQPLLWRYQSDPLVTLIPAALSSKQGIATLRVNRHEPSRFPSIDADWIQNSAHKNYYGDDACTDYEVQTLTLDNLVEFFGVPHFIKIDVEGHGLDVIEGLSVSIPALSFEMHKDWIKDTAGSIKHLDTLGSYEYNFCMGTSAIYEFKDWLTGAELLMRLDNRLAPSGREGWGDVYARLK